MHDLSPPHAGVWLVGSVVVALGGGFLAGWIHRHGLLEREAVLERNRGDDLQSRQQRAERWIAAQACARALDDAWAWRLRRRHPALVTRALCRAAGVADAADPTRSKSEVLREAVEAMRARVAELPPVPELAAELDDWVLLEREQRDVDAAAPLQELARQIDPDPRRTELRALATVSNGGRLRELAAAPPAKDDSAATLALLMKALAGAGLPDVATRLGERSVADHPDDYSLRILLADLLFDQGLPAAERARLHYEAALALRPDSSRAAAHLGWLLADQAGEGSDAVALLEVATRRHATDAALSCIRGFALARSRHFAEARQHFQRALDLDPRCALAQAGIGDTFIGRGDNQDLEIKPPPFDFGSSENSSPPDPARSEQAWSALLDQARSAYEQSLRLFDTAEGRDGLASVLWTQGEIEQASNELDEAVRRHPDDAILRGHLGGSYLARGRSLEALQQFREAVRLDEWDAGAQNDYAWELANGAEARLRRPGQALEHARRACELDGGNSWYRNTLGVACFRVGDFEQAVVELTAACDLPRGGGPLDHYFLAMAYHELGDPAAAREHYALAVEKSDPADREVERAREEAFTLLGLERSDR